MILYFYMLLHKYWPAQVGLVYVDDLSGFPPYLIFVLISVVLYIWELMENLRTQK